MSNDSRLRRYWRAKRLPLVLSVPFMTLGLATENWGWVVGNVFVAWLAWMDTP